MSANIEIKARARDWARQQAVAARLAPPDVPVELLEQCDTFFPVARGRLKLRELAPDHGELIQYTRPDQAGPKPSDYLVCPTAQPAALRETLARALGVRGVVRKRRWLYRVGLTRIHFDQVEGLGQFIELEVALAPGQSAASGRATAADLMSALGIEPGDLVEGAYVDLLAPLNPPANG